MTRLALVALLAVVVALGACAPALSVRVDQAGGQTTGFDAFRQLVTKIDEHMKSNVRVTEAKWIRDRTWCNSTLSEIMTRMDERQAALDSANKTLVAATAKLAKNKAGLPPVTVSIARTSEELTPLSKLLAEGDGVRFAEAKINEQKVKDTRALMAAVEVILSKLNGSNPASGARFAEEMASATAQVGDQEVRSLVESAMTAISKIPVYLETNIYRLKKLLWLLVRELDKYSNSVIEQEKVLAANWEESRRPLVEKTTALSAQLRGQEEKKKTIQDAIEEATKAMNAANSTFYGPVPRQLQLVKNEFTLVKARCEIRRQAYDTEVKARQDARDTLDAMEHVLTESEKRDDGVGKVLTNVIGLTIPAPTVCCRKCLDSFACGDACVTDPTTCELPPASGCACGKDDPRLAASLSF